jgi:probable blue pigment (indigoidine) exporter
MARSVVAQTLTTAVAPVVWGTTYIVSSQLLPPDRPLFGAAVRALPAGLIAVALARRLPSGGWWWRSAVLGTLNIGAFFAFLFVAAYRLPGGVGSTLGGISPLVLAGLGYLLLAETPTRWRIGWGVTGLVGVALMTLTAEAAVDGIGVVAGLAGVVSMAVGVVLTRRWGRPVDAVAFAGWQLTAGGLLLTPLALVVEGAPPALDASAVAGYVWLGLVGTLLAYVLWFDGISKLPIAPVSFLLLLAPTVATLLGWLVAGETLTALQGLGFALALTAIAAAQLPGAAWPRRRPPTVPAGPHQVRRDDRSSVSRPVAKVR